MIEAVNSVLQTAPIVRASSEQVSTADSFAANPERVQKAPQAPYVSPYIHVDVNYDKAVLQLRNSDTGDVVNQFPSQTQLEAQARSAASREVAQQQDHPAANAVAPRRTAESTQDSVKTSSNEQGGSAPAADNGPTISQQQQAAFAAAARSGNTNAGHIKLLA